jgi:hypothetical protein
MKFLTALSLASLGAKEGDKIHFRAERVAGTVQVTRIEVMKPGNSGLRLLTALNGWLPRETCISLRKPILEVERQGGTALSGRHDHMRPHLAGHRPVAMTLGDGPRRVVRCELQQAGVARLDFVAQWRSLAKGGGSLACRG